MRARRAIAVAAGMVLTAPLVLTGAEPAGSVTSVATGSWWRQQPQNGGLAAPPHVPDDGVWVSSNPSGDQSVSAVRISLGERESAPVLVLRLAQDASISGAPVVACPAGSPWQPATAGPWAAAPTADCGSGSVAGVLGIEGDLLSFDLSTMPVTGGVVDVVLTPDPTPAVPGLPVSRTFDITAAEPSPGDVKVFEAPAPSPPPGADPSPVAPGDAAPAPASPPSGSPSFNAPPAEAAAPGTLPSAPGPPAGAVDQEGGRSSMPSLTAPAENDSDRSDQIVAAAVLLALLATWYWFSTKAEGERPLRVRLEHLGLRAENRPTRTELLGGPDPPRSGLRARLARPPGARAAAIR